MPTIKHPKFDTPALADLAAAFYRRGKAIRYQGEFAVTREVEGGDERLNADYSGLSKLHLRLSVWSTGHWWFLACQPRPGRNGGWLFNHELRGELSCRPAEVLVKAFEDSTLVGSWSAGEQLAKLQEVWRFRPVTPPVTEEPGSVLPRTVPGPDTIHRLLCPGL